MTAGLIADLRAVLLHWHNTAYLETHPLARWVTRQTPDAVVGCGQALRHVLRAAIESLHPPANLPSHSPEARPYEILCRHYIGRQPIHRIAPALNISERQAYRELRSSVEALAQILMESSLVGESEPGHQNDQQIHEEIARLTAGPSKKVNLCDLVKDVAASIQQLASNKDIDIRLTVTQPDLQVTINRVMLRQALLNLLSYVVKAHQGTRIAVKLIGNRDTAHLAVTYVAQHSDQSLPPDGPHAIATQLFQLLNVECLEREHAGKKTFLVSLPLSQRSAVLLVDDNEGMLALLTRYLRHSPYRVFSANSFDKALAVLHDAHPDIVLVDIMMPDHDGWNSSKQPASSATVVRGLLCALL
jgi:hypothetical protein